MVIAAGRRLRWLAFSYIPYRTSQNCPTGKTGDSKPILTLEYGRDTVCSENYGTSFSQSQKTMQERPVTVPPYVPYRTFQTFLEFLQDGIPARIDRSVWGSRFSGSSGTQLMTALKVLGLVDSDGHPEPILEELVFAEGERRRALLRGMLEDYYRPVFQLDLARATRNQFHEAFRSFGAREGVLAKCEAFFIQAAIAAGIQLSQYVLAGRHHGRQARRKLAASKGTGRGARATQPAATPAIPVGAGQPSVRPADPATTLAPIAQAVSHEASPALAAKLNVAELILSKYPDFDPSWSTDVQAKWLDGMTKLYEGLAAAERSDAVSGGD
jgi:hypothetical protein